LLIRRLVPLDVGAHTAGVIETLVVVLAVRSAVVFAVNVF
jgi:hypothetical protein